MIKYNYTNKKLGENIMVMLESLKKSFDHGDYDDFGKLLSELHRLHYLDIEKYVKLIEHLSTYIIEEHENDG